MASPGGVETEQKYEADAASALPALLDIPGVERVAEPMQDRLEAVYFDTATLALAARRITLRRRTGGTDNGWNLKLPVGLDRRQEVHAPLGQPESVPEELLDRVLVYTRGEDLVPVARLSTGRTTYRLYGPGGNHLADFADDLVHAEALHPPGPGVDWREWEIELVHGTSDFFAAAADALTATGADRSRYGSKLARALGDAFPPEVATGTGVSHKKGPVLDVVTAYLDGQISELLAQDPGVRLGSPEALHRMRSATRRFRSTLTTYRGLFSRTEVRTLEDGLKWLARILGRPRDAEVMRERLRQHLRNLPKGLRTRTVSGPVEHALGSAYNAGYKEVLKTLESDRYYRLLDGLEHFRDHPPTRPRAFRPARKETARLVNKAAKSLDRSHQAAAHAKAGSARDAALHQVRKDAKRLRHAAESVAGIHGKRARTLSRSAHRLQRILGIHQDSVVARVFLDSLGEDTALPEGTTLVYRRIHDVEERVARAAEKKYIKARKKASGLRIDHRS
ncbi:CYTH and CHAD domain-containing protein [Arthrobacter glacialis]|uniref:CHAD domain-containing protein n=1 Tax=Arthrobacter glacialis TaxID=1664 RepID=A0A2S3ZWE0_ARTGL|nr:CYTH and CHAD domain-containing protein [Arthrobacter glacialis]POH73581.1 CHAD domain-containing protein [Arthrobacter glacialis]